MKLPELKPCAGCGREIVSIIYEVTVKRHLIDPNAARGEKGLVNMFGGSVLLADAMSSRSSITIELDSATDMYCQECALGEFIIPALLDGDEGT